ncbi:MAG: hypothetical protein FWE99_07165, partial [Bacteroidales bacterium]|nr:hypothetical protein [Bacteroidales bacterium]
AGSSFLVGTTEFFVPLGSLTDTLGEQKKLNEELDYLQGFVASVERKLSNPEFVKNAPDKVVEVERKKKQDALAKINTIRMQLKNLESNP